MQLRRSTAAVFLAFSLTAVAGCAANLAQQSAGEYIDDAVITTKVKAAILDQPALKSSEISVDTFKGAVRLRGVVASQSTIDKAVEIARRVNGVRLVRNEMQRM